MPFTTQKIRLLAVLLALSLLAGTPFASAQDVPGDDPSTADGKKEKTDDVPGQGKLSQFGETLANSWSISSAFQGTQSFDDNVFLANNFRKSDTVSKLSGRITVAYRGKHTRFESNYLPEFSLYQRYDPLNYVTHNYSQSLVHDFSRRTEFHWKTSVHQAPSRGNLPFTLVNFGGMIFNMYSLDALNNGMNVFNADNSIGASYRWSSRLRFNADLNGAVSRFTEKGNPVLPVVSQEMTYSTGVHLGFDYTLKPGRALGVKVNNTYFGFISPNNHQYTHSVEATFSQTLPKRYQLNASVGPGVTRRQGGRAAELGVFYEVSLARNLQRSGFAISFRRGNQVGLLQDSVSDYGAAFRLNRNFGRKWITNAGGTYTRAQSTGGAARTELASGTAQIGYRLTRQIIPFMNYGYSHQKALIASPNIRNVNRNEVSLGFVYNFGVVAGR